MDITEPISILKMKSVIKGEEIGRRKGGKERAKNGVERKRNKRGEET